MAKDGVSHDHFGFLHFSMEREGLDTFPVDSEKAKALVSDSLSPRRKIPQQNTLALESTHSPTHITGCNTEELGRRGRIYLEMRHSIVPRWPSVLIASPIRTSSSFFKRFLKLAASG